MINSGIKKHSFLKWEWMLILMLILINIMNASLSPYYLNYFNISSAVMAFLDKAFMVFPMAFIMMMGDIDISVASTVALSSVIMGIAVQAGLPMPLAIVLCLGTATLCGWINGMIITRFKELSAAIVTISTMILYRGIAYIILEDQAASGFPEWFSFLGWESIGPIPFIVIVFTVFAVLFWLILHKTIWGRRILAIGQNNTASIYSGINVDKIRLMAFTSAGFMAGISSLFLTSKMASTRPNIAVGYELEVIAIVVLGGVSTSGGRGKIHNVIMAVFVIGLLKYGLGLINIHSQLLSIIIGILLILSTLLPNLGEDYLKKKKLRSNT
ncbi:MAG: ABC transporter permease [Spirochaetales bacterium]|nr:ABC transporter permease [Spirochaetales bacterium]